MDLIKKEAHKLRESLKTAEDCIIQIETLGGKVNMEVGTDTKTVDFKNISYAEFKVKIKIEQEL